MSLNFNNIYSNIFVNIIEYHLYELILRLFTSMIKLSKFKFNLSPLYIPVIFIYVFFIAKGKEEEIIIIYNKLNIFFEYKLFILSFGYT